MNETRILQNTIRVEIEHPRILPDTADVPDIPDGPLVEDSRVYVEITASKECHDLLDAAATAAHQALAALAPGEDPYHV